MTESEATFRGVTMEMRSLVNRDSGRRAGEHGLRSEILALTSICAPDPDHGRVLRWLATGLLQYVMWLIGRASDPQGPSDHLPGGRHLPFSSSPLPRGGWRQGASLDSNQIHQLMVQILSSGRLGRKERWGKGSQSHGTGRQFKQRVNDFHSEYCSVALEG